MPVNGLDLIVNRSDLSEVELVQSTFPDTPPDGACLLRVEKFALTANNITYGVAADMLGYWDFFPAEKTAMAAFQSGDLPKLWRRLTRKWQRESVFTAICPCRPT